MSEKELKKKEQEVIEALNEYSIPGGIYLTGELRNPPYDNPLRDTVLGWKIPDKEFVPVIVESCMDGKEWWAVKRVK
jgi:hypothetical protein